jgi:hypothetical protein
VKQNHDAEIKRCAHCGKIAECITIILDKTAETFWIHCTNDDCGVCTPEFKSRAEVVRVWNKRSPTL